MLVQTNDATPVNPETWSCVSKLKPNPAQLQEMAFAMSICKHVKSNAIVLSSRLQSIGIGAGQMSRIDSLHIAVNKSRELGHSLAGAVLASDAFFPFRDCVEAAAKAGIRAIVQPGGSVRDQESIDAANDHGIVMMLTGVRHFKH
jgi:phosphoribosylaminoimidazolecarboxamide formyltransferase/IMP cyclohydrolase